MMEDYDVVLQYVKIDGYSIVKYKSLRSIRSALLLVNKQFFHTLYPQILQFLKWSHKLETLPTSLSLCVGHFPHNKINPIQWDKSLLYEIVSGRHLSIKALSSVSSKLHSRINLEALNFICENETFRKPISHITRIEKGTKLTHIAACVRNVNALIELHQLGCDMKSPTEFGSTPLDYACSPLSVPSGDKDVQGRTQTIKWLIEHTSSDKSTCNSKMVEEIMKLGTSISFEKGSTLLSCLVMTEFSEKVFNCLLDVGARIDATNKNGEQPIHHATKIGNELAVKKLLENGADVNAKTCHGETPLHIAVINKNKSLVLLLLQNGALITKKTKLMCTPFDKAAIAGDKEILEILVKHTLASSPVPSHLASSVNEAEIPNLIQEFLRLGQSAEPLTKTAAGNAETHWLDVLTYFGGIICNSLEEEEEQEDDNDDEEEDDDDDEAGSWVDSRVTNTLKPQTVLTNKEQYIKDWTIPLSDNQIRAKRIIKVHTRLDYEPADEFANPIVAAVQKGHTDVVKLLIAKGANVNISLKTGSKLIHVAASNGHLEIVKELIPIFDIDRVDDDKNTPLLHACKSGRANVAEWLCEHGANPNAKNFLKVAPLHCAAMGGHGELIQVLVKHGALLDDKCGQSKTPLMYAVVDRRLEAAKALLECGADKTGALCTAAVKGYPDMVELLASLGCSVDEKISGQSAFQLAAQARKYDVIKVLLKLGAEYSTSIKTVPVEILKLIIESGIDLEVRGQHGHTLLCQAIMSGFTDKIELLLDAGAKMELAMSGFHYAVLAGTVNIVELLIDKGVPVDIEDETNKNYTPLQVACKHNSVGMASMLLKKGADFNRVWNSQFTPMDFALQANSKKIFSMLVEAGVNITQVFPDGKTYIHKAIKAFAESTSIRMLVEAGGLVNDESGPYGSSLYYAMVMGHFHAIGVLYPLYVWKKKPKSTTIFVSFRQQWTFATVQEFFQDWSSATIAPPKQVGDFSFTFVEFPNHQTRRKASKKSKKLKGKNDVFFFKCPLPLGARKAD